MGLKLAFWRKAKDENKYLNMPFVDEPRTKPKPQAVDDGPKEQTEALKADKGTNSEQNDGSSSVCRGVVLESLEYSISLNNKDSFKDPEELRKSKRRLRAENYNRQHFNRMRDGKGKKVYTTWPVTWKAYSTKYKAFKVLETYHNEYKDGLPCVYIALNSGLKLKSIKDGCTKWVKSGHIRVIREDHGIKIYTLDMRGWRLLDRLRKFQPYWCRVRDAELKTWSLRLSERWQQFDRIDLHSPHRVMREFKLE